MIQRGRTAKTTAATLVALVLLVWGCGDDSPSTVTTLPPIAAGNLVLYTSMPVPIVDRLKGVFEGAFPDIEGNLWIAPGETEAGGITLEVLRGRTADIQQQITEDLASGRVGADLIWLAEPSVYELYKEQGILAAYALPPGTPVPEEFRDPDGFYVAGRVINMVVAWNTDLRPEGMTDWTELYKSRPAVFPSPGSGAARAAIKALTDTFGDGFFERFAQAGGTAVDSNGDARDGLVAGTFEAAGVLDYMIREARAGGSPVDFAYPESGTVVIPSPIAITSDAANPEAAKVFVDFVLSRQGQQIVVEVGSFYPARSDVAPPAGAPPLHEISSLVVDWNDLSDESAEISADWEELFGADEPRPPIRVQDSP